MHLANTRDKQGSSEDVGGVWLLQSIPTGLCKLTKGMNKLRNSDNFEWTKEHEENFQRLKKQFATCGVRAAPVYKGKEEFLLTIDFSGLALGAVLSQVQEGQ